MEHGPEQTPLPRKYMQMANKHMQRCPTSYIIKEMHIKTPTRYHCTPVRMAKIWNTDDTKRWWGCRTIGILIHCWWECKMVQPLQKTVWWFLTKLNIFVIIWSSNHAPWYLPKGVENVCPHKNLHRDVCSSFIPNWQNLEATKMSFSRWMDKLVHPDSVIFSAKKKWAIKPWKDMEEP